MATKMGGKTVVLIIVAVAILVGIIVYASLANRGAAPGTATQSSAATGTPVFAPKGEITAGFPKALILDSNPSVDGSYSINYSANLNQYTAEWNSSSSMETLYNAYKTYLPAHGWTIVNSSAQYPKIRGIYATNASSDVSVAITTAAGGSHAAVTYVAK